MKTYLLNLHYSKITLNKIQETAIQTGNGIKTNHINNRPLLESETF